MPPNERAIKGEKNKDDRRTDSGERKSERPTGKQFAAEAIRLGKLS